MATLVTSARAVPGPPASFLTGNAVALRRDLLGEFVRDRARYGDLVRYQIGPRPPLGRTFLVAHHPDDVRLVLSQTGRTLTKDTAMFRAAGDVLGHSLLTDDGPGYRRQRRIVQPLFTARQVARYAPLMLQEASGRGGRLADEGIAPGTAEPGRPAPAGHALHAPRRRTHPLRGRRGAAGPGARRPDATRSGTRSAVAGCRWRRCRCGGPRCATAGPDGCTGSCRTSWRRSSRAPHAAASATAGTTSSAGCTTPPTPPVRCLTPGRTVRAASPRGTQVWWRRSWW